jgi:uncharacterized protein
MNTFRSFDSDIAKALGEYVYVLRDPRDRKVFYVGKGNGDRLFQHFKEADEAKLSQRPWAAKLRRIVEIWEADEDVDWFIVRRNLGALVGSNPLTAFDVEGAIIDVLEISQNGLALNDIAGKGSKSSGILTSNDIFALAAKDVGPSYMYELVFVFPIQNALAQGRSVYDATRGWWSVSQDLQSRQKALAVGIANGLSKEVYSVDCWRPASAIGKFEFNGTHIQSHELGGKNWTTVINAAMGYWQRGNYLVVEFSGNNKFRFIRGSADKSIWWNV